MEKAKAAVFMGANKPFEVREFDITKTPPGMAKLKIHASGVCGTDIHIHRGKLSVNAPSIIGHEFVGQILETGEGENYGLRVGDNVIVCIAIPCGECLLCKNGDDANCVNMKVSNGGDINVAPHLYGGYTQINYSPLSTLIKIPDGIDPVAACVFACPGPTAFHAVNLAKQANVDFTKIKTAVVQGLGPVGLFCVMYLKSLKIPAVIAVTNGQNPMREELAKQLGADYVKNISTESEESVTDFIREKTSGLGADLVIEASGGASAVPMGLNMLRNRGVYLIPGQYSDNGEVPVLPQLITFKALHIIGSSQYSVKDIHSYLNFLKENPVLIPKIKELASFYKISDVNTAFEDAKAGKNLKTVLTQG